VNYTARQILGPGGHIARQLPGYEHREPQLKMADLVEWAIQTNQDAAIEAGTGTGKSLAYLVPAILSKKTTIVSTADKSLQEQIDRKDIPFLKGVMPVPFRAALLKGRSNYPCLYRVGQLRDNLAGVTDHELGFRTPEAAAAWPAFNRWVAGLEHSGRVEDCEKAIEPVPLSLLPDVTITSEECLGERCPVKAACIAEKAKKNAREADVVIVNHALLLLDLKMRYESEGAATVLPDADTLIVDECHHLQDKATDTFGVEVSEYSFRDLERKILKLLARTHSDELSEEGQRAQDWQTILADVSGRLDGFLNIIRTRLESIGANVQRLGDEMPLVRDLIATMMAVAWKMERECPPGLEVEQRDMWAKYTDRLVGFCSDLDKIVTPNDDDVIRFAKLDGPPNRKRLLLCGKPIDVAPVLREALFTQFKTVVSTSATIAANGNIRYWRETVGMDSTRELVLPSPFDFRRNALLYLPSNERQFDPSARWGGDGSLDYLERLSAEIERLILASHGRAFVLFTSYRTLLDVYDRISARLSRFLVLKQGELPRPEILKQFRTHGSAVLFGTKSFWEGVDIQGEALSLVIIDKLPFVPPDDPVWDARKEKLTRETRDEWAWFNKLAIPYATIALKQGAGRLIRSQSDRGVIAILDGRLSFKPYGRRIVGSLPPAVQTRSIDAVKAFFAADMVAAS